MGPGSEGGEEFVVEEVEPDVYNPTGIEPPVWQPAPQDILLMFEQLEKDQVLPLKWVCPGRRLPESDAPEQPLNDMTDGEEGDDDKEEEKRAPEPSAFDFDDSASEASTKVKMTPRTPAQAKRPERKVACMDNIISSLKRQQKAEREARKSQARSLGMTGFRGGTSSRMAGFSPTSPRVSAAVSPGPGSPRGSPRIPALASSPSSRLVDTGEGTEKKATPTESSIPKSGAASSPAPAPGHEHDVQSPSCKGPFSEASTTDMGSVDPSGPASSSAGYMVTVKVEKDIDNVKSNPEPLETDTDLSDIAIVKQEG
ncbi:uncharacterized protein LOC143288460 [Babylonia areolata]|uniref:uncharacterized protein LOC143288460 n=1 Tax=Babylonia areolata TaxID=304850 RepID=UPI003FD1E401